MTVGSLKSRAEATPWSRFPCAAIPWSVRRARVGTDRQRTQGRFLAGCDVCQVLSIPLLPMRVDQAQAAASASVPSSSRHHPSHSWLVPRRTWDPDKAENQSVAGARWRPPHQRTKYRSHVCRLCRCAYSLCMSWQLGPCGQHCHDPVASCFQPRPLLRAQSAIDAS